jgi:hypothetical protein
MAGGVTREPNVGSPGPRPRVGCPGPAHHKLGDAIPGLENRQNRYERVWAPIPDGLRAYEQNGDPVVLATGQTAEGRTQLLESGKLAVYENRIGWARTYLKKGRPARGFH